MNALRAHSLNSPFRLALVAAFAGLASCQPADEGNEVEDGNAANEVALNLPAVPLPEPPMNREVLLTAVARAASAAAAGVAETGEQRLDGRRFELRIRFGCRGPAPQLREAVLGWTFDSANRTLRVRAMPTITREDELVGQILGQVNGERIESVEGFWIPRPWLLEPVCPAAAAVGEAPEAPEGEGPAQRPPAPQASQPRSAVEDQQESEAPPSAWPKVGIAQFFRETDPRTRRRAARPYEVVKTFEAGQAMSSQGFNLVLSGRLRALPGRRAIACVPVGPDNPPECIISAAFDRVWIERPDTREILAEWGVG